MDSFEFNKLIGALLGTVFVVFSVGIVSDAIFAVAGPEKPGFEIVAAEEPAGSGWRRGGSRRRADRPRCWRQPTPRPAKPSSRNARPATPPKTAAPTRSARTSGASSTVRSPRMRASPIRPAMKAFARGRQGGLGLRPSERLPDLARRPSQRHGDGLCRPQEDRGARQLIAYLRTLADSPRRCRK